MLCVGLGLLSSVQAHLTTILPIFYSAHDYIPKCPETEQLTASRRDVLVWPCVLVIVSGLTVYLGHHIHSTDSYHSYMDISVKLSDRYSTRESSRSKKESNSKSSARSHHFFSRDVRCQRKISTSLAKDIDIISALPDVL